MGALCEQQGGASVPEVVKADVRPGFAERPPEQRLEGAVAEVGGVYESASVHSFLFTTTLKQRLAIGNRRLPVRFGLGGVWGAYKRHLLPSAVCTVGQVGLLLAYWREMALYYERHRGERE